MGQNHAEWPSKVGFSNSPGHSICGLASFGFWIVDPSHQFHPPWFDHAIWMQCIRKVAKWCPENLRCRDQYVLLEVQTVLQIVWTTFNDLNGAKFSPVLCACLTVTICECKLCPFPVSVRHLNARKAALSSKDSSDWSSWVWSIGMGLSKYPT